MKKNRDIFFNELNRVDFLKLTGFTLMAGMLSTVTACSGDQVGPNTTDKEVRVVHSFAEVMLPEKAGQKNTLQDLKLAEGLDRVFAYQHVDFTSNIRMAIRVLEHSPYFWDLKFSRFSQMQKEDRKKYVLSLMDSDSVMKRSVAVGVKTVTLMAMFESPVIGNWMGINPMELCR